MKNKERSDTFTFIKAGLMLIFFIVAIIFILKGIIVDKDPILMFGCIIFASLIAFNMIFKHTKSGKEIWDNLNQPDNERKEREKRQKQVDLEEAIYRNTYTNIPIKLNKEQLAEYDKAFFAVCTKIFDMGAKTITLSKGMTDEELYTLWIIKKTYGPVRIYAPDGTEMTADVIFQDGEIIIPDAVEDFLKPYKRVIPEIPQEKKRSKRKIEAIKKQRKAHKKAVARKKEAREKNAEAAAMRRNAKKHQPPNYEFYAKEWISQNMGYVNKLIAGATVCGEKYANSVIPVDKLPNELVTQQLIAKKLKDDGVICRYDIDNNGMTIKAKTKYS